MVFGCLTRTVSPNLILLSLAPSFCSAYAFIFLVCSPSLSARFCVSKTICWRSDAGDANSGRVVLSFIWFSASHGETPVVECGVARFCRKNLLSSCFQFLCSIVAALMHLSSVVMKRSASPFALGQRGVILRCWKPKCSAKFLKSAPSCEDCTDQALEWWIWLKWT